MAGAKHNHLPVMLSLTGHLILKSFGENFIMRFPLSRIAGEAVGMMATRLLIYRV